IPGYLPGVRRSPLAFACSVAVALPPCGVVPPWRQRPAPPTVESGHLDRDEGTAPARSRGAGGGAGTTMARSRAASAAHSGPGPRSGPAADSPSADPAAPERTPDPAPGTGSAAAPPPAGAGLAPAGLSGRLLGLLHLLTSFALS